MWAYCTPLHPHGSTVQASRQADHCHLIRDVGCTLSAFSTQGAARQPTDLIAGGLLLDQNLEGILNRDAGDAGGLIHPLERLNAGDLLIT